MSVFAFDIDRNRHRHRGISDAEANRQKQQKQTWLCLLQSPRLVPHVGLLRDSHSPHRGGLIQESVAAGERCMCVCVWVSVSRFSTNNQRWSVKWRRSHTILPILPSYSVFFSLLHSSPRTEWVSVCMCEEAGCTSLQWVCVNVCECACPPQRWQYVTLAGGRAGSVVCTSLLLWWLESAQMGEWLPQHTHTHTHLLLLPLLPATLLSPIPVEQWWDEPSLSLAQKGRVSVKERKKKGWSKEGRKEEQEERKGTSLFFWQTGDIASLVLLRELGAWDSHKVSSTPSPLTKSQLQCLAKKSH